MENVSLLVLSFKVRRAAVIALIQRVLSCSLSALIKYSLFGRLTENT